MTPAADEARVRELVEQYRTGFALLDPPTLTALWDRDHDHLVYVAQEVAEPMHGWAAIEAYYEALPVVHPASALTGSMHGTRSPQAGRS